MSDDHEIMSRLGGMVLEEERDEAREVARQLLNRLLLFGDGHPAIDVRREWVAKYPWLKVEKWP